jgi:hypothetical protein
VREALWGEGIPSGTLLDFGCGLGDFSSWVPQVEYVGYDWAPGMVERAQKEHGSKRRRFTNEMPEGRFDVVVCIGPFNLPGSFEETWETLGKLWSRSKYCLAVCLYYGNDPSCLSYSPSCVASFADSKAEFWTLEKHRHNDLLMVLRR